MERVLWIREKSGSKEKSESNQHVAITKAICILGDPGAHFKVLWGLLGALS